MINNGGEIHSRALLYPKCLITLGQSSVVDIMKSLHSFYQYFTIFSATVKVLKLKWPVYPPLSLPLLLHSMTLDLIFIGKSGTNMSILILKVIWVCWLTRTCLNLLVGLECTKGAAGSVHLCIVVGKLPSISHPLSIRCFRPHLPTLL